jgi:hypothetical protein
MIYISTLSFLFIIISFSNFLTIKFYVKNNQSFLVSCCVIILLSFFSFYLDKEYNFNTLNYLFYFFFIFSIYLFSFVVPIFSKIKKGINLEFIFFFLIIFYLSKDRYYLDQDEFSYWGQSLKEVIFGLKPYNDFSHHPKGTTLFQYLLVFFKYKEGLAIFANNILLISGYFYLFYERKLLTIEKIILFLIYYLLLNNLSFGFLSIYSDAVLAVFFSCLLKLIYFFVANENKKENLQFFISFLIIFLTMLLINRASIIYALFLLFIFFAFFIYKNIKNKFFNLIYYLGTLVLILFFLYFYPEFILRGYYGFPIIIQNVVKFINHYFISINFIELFTSPIYFSHFGALVNGILTFFTINNFVPQFQIPLVVYILLLWLILLFNFRYKFFFFLISFFSIFIYSIIVFILKFQIEKLSILALQRYIGIYLLSNFFFFISIINKNFKIIYKNYILIFFIIFLISVTPKKTLSLLATDRIYYSNLSNQNFKFNRDRISQLKNILNINNIDSFFIIHKERMSDYTNNNIKGEHTFYYNIITYELYPKKIIFVEYDKFKKNINYYKSCKSNNCFLIFFDLSQYQLKKINYFENSFTINTY